MLPRSVSRSLSFPTTHSTLTRKSIPKNMNTNVPFVNESMWPGWVQKLLPFVRSSRQDVPTNQVIYAPADNYSAYDEPDNAVDDECTPENQQRVILGRPRDGVIASQSEKETEHPTDNSKYDPDGGETNDADSDDGWEGVEQDDEPSSELENETMAYEHAVSFLENEDKSDPSFWRRVSKETAGISLAYQTFMHEKFHSIVLSEVRLRKAYNDYKEQLWETVELLEGKKRGERNEEGVYSSYDWKTTLLCGSLKGLIVEDEKLTEKTENLRNMVRDFLKGYDDELIAELNRIDVETSETDEQQKDTYNDVSDQTAELTKQENSGSVSSLLKHEKVSGRSLGRIKAVPIYPAHQQDDEVFEQLPLTDEVDNPENESTYYAGLFDQIQAALEPTAGNETATEELDTEDYLVLSGLTDQTDPYDDRPISEAEPDNVLDNVLPWEHATTVEIGSEPADVSEQTATAGSDASRFAGPTEPNKKGVWDLDRVAKRFAWHKLYFDELAVREAYSKMNDKQRIKQCIKETFELKGQIYTKKEFNREFEKVNQTSVTIHLFFNELLMEGSLVAFKYNGSSDSVFYGLREWVQKPETKTGFRLKYVDKKAAYFPDKIVLKEKISQKKKEVQPPVNL